MIFVARGGGIYRRDHLLARSAVVRAAAWASGRTRRADVVMTSQHRLATRADLPATVDIYNSVMPERSTTCDLVFVGLRL